MRQTTSISRLRAYNSCQISRYVHPVSGKQLISSKLTGVFFYFSFKSLVESAYVRVRIYLFFGFFDWKHILQNSAQVPPPKKKIKRTPGLEPGTNRFAIYCDSHYAMCTCYDVITAPLPRKNYFSDAKCAKQNKTTTTPPLSSGAKMFPSSKGRNLPLGWCMNCLRGLQNNRKKKNKPKNKPK